MTAPLDIEIVTVESVLDNITSVIPVSNPPVIVGVTVESAIAVVEVGNVGGPMGPQGQWVSMTQAQFDALPVKDPDTLYVIIG